MRPRELKVSGYEVEYDQLAETQAAAGVQLIDEPVQKIRSLAWWRVRMRRTHYTKNQGQFVQP